MIVKQFLITSLLIITVLVSYTDGQAAKVSRTPSRARPSKRLKQLYTVEVLFVIDHASYSKWLTFAGNKKKAMTVIKQYFAHVMNGIKASYEKIVMSGISITITLVGFYIADTKDKLSFMEQSLDSYDTINYVQATSYFYDWVKKKPKTLMKFDVALLFTGYKMGGANGYGYLSTACTTAGVSMAMDDNYFYSTHTATHEIGHNLGARHDGSAGCNDNDAYVMSGSRLGGNVNNLYKFSKCSLDQFKSYFDKLNRDGNNCFLNSPTKNEYDKIKNTLKLYPGMQFGHEEQCRIAYGNDSSMCPDKYNYGDKMCQRMTCWYRGKSACWTLVPTDGTPCDNKKWCIREKCVYDKRAPTLDTKCRFGDYAGVINTDRGYLSCQQIAQYPEYCKIEFYNSLYCCKSCRTTKPSKKPPAKRTKKPSTKPSKKPTVNI